MTCKRCGKPIAEHEAGRETDACVAECVMNQEASYYPIIDRWEQYHSYGWADLKTYSTSWSAMGEVVERMLSRKYEFHLGNGYATDYQWGCTLHYGDEHYSRMASTAPLAVARAALAAVAEARD